MEFHFILEWKRFYSIPWLCNMKWSKILLHFISFHTVTLITTRLRIFLTWRKSKSTQRKRSRRKKKRKRKEKIRNRRFLVLIKSKKSKRLRRRVANVSAWKSMRKKKRMMMSSRRTTVKIVRKMMKCRLFCAFLFFSNWFIQIQSDLAFVL